MEKTPKQMANELLNEMNRVDAKRTVTALIDDLRREKHSSLKMVEVATQIEFLNKVKEELN